MRILPNTFIEFFDLWEIYCFLLSKLLFGYLHQMPKNAFPPLYVARHSIEEFGSKSNIYALVLNVRNEGERLANQLERLRQYRSCVDIVVSDAPSSDGSTHSVRLKKAGVTTLISLLEPGRYSASALAAFAHCRDRGYRGVILMDGNDKDDPEAIPRFVMRLDEDFDFIQGSRYIDGGKAIRMPATRDFLIRIVHAPIFSFLCGWGFTDTTNGFRACSMKLLCSPQVSPFRSVFKGYDIVFYLPWAACRYGFRVTEIPVTRAYPADGTVPSHLNSVSGYWRMLRPLLMLATRRF